jgi:D-glycero-D-manno-heptose 1,7-bisphosphate phosphatase
MPDTLCPVFFPRTAEEEKMPGSEPRQRRAAFLDRDGVINVDAGYIYRVEDFRFVPGTLEACAALARAGWALVVVTNQSGIARGMYTQADFQILTDWMSARFEEAGAPLAGVYFCPHHPTEGRGSFAIPCRCRKPNPGMLLDAARDLGLDLAGSILFGDKCEDLQAGRAAGVAHRVLLGRDGHSEAVEFCAPELSQASFASLRDAVLSDALAPLIRSAIDA